MLHEQDPDLVVDGELQADLEAGKLEPDAYQAARHDLERELLNDTDTATEAEPQAQRSGRWAIGVFGPLIPALAVFLYLQLGAAPLLERSTRPPVAEKPEQEPAHSLQDMVQKLAARLEEDPDNVEGWVMLGRSYAALDRYQEAENAYAQARRIAGDHPQLLVDSADIMVMANGGRFTSEAAELLERALHVRHWGRDRAMDEGVLPSFEYLENWPSPELGERQALDPVQFKPVMDEYYGYLGWDVETGWPTQERLQELGMELAVLLAPAQPAVGIDPHAGRQQIQGQEQQFPADVRPRLTHSVSTLYNDMDPCGPAPVDRTSRKAK